MGTTISLVLNFLFVFILIVGFLIGLWRGLKKASVNLAFSIVGILLAFFITPAVTNSALTINITINGVRQTISEFIISQVGSSADIALLIESNPNLAVVLNHLPNALVSTIVFILLTLVIEFFIYIIYKIIAVTCLKTKPGKKRHRLLGGAVGTVRAFLLSIFAFMPLAALIGLANDVNKSDELFLQAQAAEQYNGDAHENLGLIDRFAGNKEAGKIIKAADSSVFSLVGGVCGLDNAMFDYLSSFKVEGQSFAMRKEIKTYAQAANVYLQLQDDINSNMKFASINFEKLDVYVKSVIDSTLFKTVAANVVADVIENYRNYSFSSSISDELKEIFDEVGSGLSQISPSTYFSNDLTQVYSAFKNLAKSGALDELKNLKPQEGQEKVEILDQITVLTNDAYFQNTANAVDNLFSMHLVRDSVSVLTDKVLSQIVEGLDKIEADTSSYLEENWKTLSSQFSTLLKDASVALDTINLEKTLSDPTSLIDPSDETNLADAVTVLGKLIDDIRAIDLFKNSEGKSIIDSTLEKIKLTLPEGDVFDNDGNKVSVTNYQQMFAFIAPSLQEIKSMNFYQFTKQGVNFTPAEVFKLLATASQGSDEYLSDILLPLSQMPLTNQLIFNEVLENIAGENNLIDFGEIMTYETRKHDFVYMGQLINALNQSYNGTTLIDALLSDGADMVDILMQEGINRENIIKPVLYAHSTYGLRNKIYDAIDSISSSLGKEGKVNRPEVMDEKAANEIYNAFESLIGLYKNVKDLEANLGGGTLDVKDLDVDKIGEFIYEIKDSEIFSGVLDAVADKVVENIPTEHQEAFEQALAEAGAADIKEYIEKADVSAFINNFKIYFGQNEG